jgi:hypothetical protein
MHSFVLRRSSNSTSTSNAQSLAETSAARAGFSAGAGCGALAAAHSSSSLRRVTPARDTRWPRRRAAPVYPQHSEKRGTAVAKVHVFLEQNADGRGGGEALHAA